MTKSFERAFAARGIVNGGVFHAFFSYPSAPNNGLVKGLSSSSSSSSSSKRLLSVPTVSALSTTERDASKSPLPGVSDELWKQFKITTRLSLLLLTEWQKGSSSSFADYIALIEEEPRCTPLNWDAESLSVLKSAYPSMAAAVEKQSGDYKKLYGLLQPYVGPRGVSYDRFVWSMEAVRSRAFQGLGGADGDNGSNFIARAAAAGAVVLGSFALVSSGTNLPGGELLPMALATAASLSLLPAVLQARTESCVLLPGIDSANHHSQRLNSVVDFDPSLPAFVLSARGSIAAGSEVLISYGNRDNDDLLQYFGFVEADNPWDLYKALLPGGAALIVTKRERATWVVPQGVDDEEIKRVLTAQLALLSSSAPPVSASFGPLLGLFLEEKRAVLQKALGLLSQ